MRDLFHGLEEGLTLSAAMRVCVPGSKARIIEILVPIMERLCKEPEQFGVLRSEAIEMLRVQVFQSKHPTQNLSYGQAAKIVDYVLKYLVHPHGFPEVIRKRLDPVLHPVIDSPILNNYRVGLGLRAESLAQLGQEEHKRMEEKLIAEAGEEGLTVAEYDDELWERFSGPRKETPND